jgi:hypothetical protein
MAAFALLALLLQQVAFAAYTCPLPQAPAAQLVMADCAAMAAPDPALPLLCDQHCQRDHVATPDTKPPQVPALTLPPVHFALAEALLLPAPGTRYQDIPVCQSDPPPAQRFCSLQI